ncbi:hypothetical protein [Terriglobus sp. RCC_193]|uniref:hypothetical protein n=1 Tax=Terriglobus sp. RCC_193 TaxID=3239218 RepID=UPI00352692AB
MRCEGKDSYPSESAALAAERFYQRGIDGYADMHSYHCDRCGEWHHAHIVPSFLRSRKKRDTRKRRCPKMPGLVVENLPSPIRAHSEAGVLEGTTVAQ